MTEIKLVMPINIHSQEHEQKIREIFSDFVLHWQFEGLTPCVFQTEIINEELSDFHAELNLQSIAISFCCTIDVSTQEDSSIFWLDVDENVYDEWDEFHFYELRRLYMSLSLAIAISHPELSIACAPIWFYIEGKLFNKDLCFTHPMQNDAYRSHPEIFASTLSLQKTFDWLVAKTDSFHSKEKPISSISALSYILNRDIRETLVYSSIGLEGIYVPEARNERQRLKQRIQLVFPQIATEDIINRMYTLRSKFVHGEYSMGVYPLMDPMPDAEEQEVEQVAQFSIAILIESIRLLIAHDATSMKFSEITTYAFQV